MDAAVIIVAFIIIALSGRTGACYDNSIELITQDLYTTEKIKVEKKDKKQKEKKQNVQQEPILNKTAEGFSTLSAFDNQLDISAMIKEFEGKGGQ